MGERRAAEAGGYRLPVAEVLQALGTDAGQGLSEVEAGRRLAEAGLNELVERGGRTPWQILWDQLTETLVVVLVAAAVISGIVGSVKDAVAITAIVALFVTLGFIQEYRAERAIAALRRLAVPTVRVTRDGRLQEVASTRLVPGDIIQLETGNLVPADVRLLEAINLRIQEAALTGESEPVDKSPEPLPGPDLPLGDRRNMAYVGTVVTYGRGQGVVVATGMETELGCIAGLLQEIEPEPTPLQRRLERLGRVLAVVGVATAVLVFFLGLLRGGELTVLLLTGVSLAVAVIPEGLPAVVTITLALGAQRMLRRHALIRRLPAVETLGSVTVIGSDKTGTLTENRMTVVALDVAGHRLEVTEPMRHRLPTLVLGERQPRPGGEGAPSLLRALLVIGALSNDAQLQQGGERGQYHALGDPTDAALVIASASAGLWKGELEQALPRVAEAPFDSERKRMTTVHRVPGPGPAASALGLAQVPYVALSKGSVDGLLAISQQVWVDSRSEPLTADWRARIEAANEQLAQQGMRVLGAAFRPLAAFEEDGQAGRLERDLIFVGLFGLIDPPRPEVEEAVRTSKAAGVRPVMITGDHPLTARQIAYQLGITETGRVLTGLDLDRLPASELRELVDEVAVYARVSPQHKLRIVEALQDRGQVVAMTGDGVNDAPALRKADIGVAMGITGTDVAKEAANMVLLDDNFATIVAATEEGRVIYDNVRKFIRFSIAGNLGKVLVMLVFPFLGILLPLLPIQLLWLNLLTDGLLGLGLGVERAEPDIMRRPPQRPEESIFGRGIGRHIIWVGILTGALAIALGYWSWASGRPNWQTVIFTSLAFTQVGHAAAARSFREPLLSVRRAWNPLLWTMVAVVLLAQVAVVYAPALQGFFETLPLTALDLALIVAASAVLVAGVELEKRLIL